MSTLTMPTQTIAGSTISAGGQPSLGSPFYPSRDANFIIGTDEYNATGNITFGNGASVVFGRPRTTSSALLTNANAPYRFNATSLSWEVNPDSIVAYDYVFDQLIDLEERITIRLSTYSAQHTIFQGNNTCRPVFYGVDFVIDTQGDATATSFNWFGDAAGTAPGISQAAPSFYNCRMIRRQENRGDLRWFGTNYLIKGFEQVSSSSSRTGAGFGQGAMYEVGTPPNEPPVGFELNAPNYRSFGQRVVLPFYRAATASDDQYSFRNFRVNNFTGFTGTQGTPAQRLQRKSHERGVTLINSASRAGIPYAVSNSIPVNAGSAAAVTTSPTLPIILSAKDPQFAGFGAQSQKLFGAGTINGFQSVILNLPETGFTIRVKRTAVRSYEHRGIADGSTVGLAAGTFAYTTDSGPIRPSNGILHRTAGDLATDFTAAGESDTETFGDGNRITTTFASLFGGTVPARFTTVGSVLADARTNTNNFEPTDDTSLNQQAVDADAMSDGLIAWQGLDTVATSTTTSQTIYLPTYWQGLFNGNNNPVPTFFFRYELWAEKDNHNVDQTVRVLDFRPEASTNDLNRPFKEGNSVPIVINFDSLPDVAYGSDRDNSASGPGVASLQHLYDSIKQFNRTRGVADYNTAHLNTQTPLFTLNSGGYIDIGSRGLLGTTAGQVVSADGSTLSVRFGTLTNSSFAPTTNADVVRGIATTGTIDLATSGLEGSNMSFNGGTLNNVFGNAVDGVSPFRLAGSGVATSGTTIDFGNTPTDRSIRISGYDITAATLMKTGAGTITLSFADNAPTPSTTLPAGFAIETDTILSNDLSVPVAYSIATVGTNGVLSNVNSGTIAAVQDDGTPSTRTFTSSDYQAGSRVRIRFSAVGYSESIVQLDNNLFNNFLLTQTQSFSTSNFLTLNLSYTAPTNALPGTRNALSITNAITGVVGDDADRSLIINVQTGGTPPTADVTYQLHDDNQLIATGTRLGIEFRDTNASTLTDAQTVQALQAIKGSDAYALACLHNNIINIIEAQDTTTGLIDDRYVILVPQGFNTGHYVTGVGRTPAAATALGNNVLLAPSLISVERTGQTNTTPSETIVILINNLNPGSGISSSVFNAGVTRITTAIDTTEAEVIRSVEDNAL